MATVKIVNEANAEVRLRDTKPGDYFVMGASAKNGHGGKVFVRAWSDEDDKENGAYHIVLLDNPKLTWSGNRTSSALDWPVHILPKGTKLAITI